MTGRERVLRAIGHREPDRVPVGEWGIDHDHVSRILGRPTFWRNRRETTLALWQNRRDEVVEGLKRDCAELAEALGYDLITVDLVPPKSHRCDDPPREVSEGLWLNSKGEAFRYAASNDSIQCVTPPEGRERVPDHEILDRTERLNDFDETAFELADDIGDRYGEERAVLFRGIDIYDALMGVFGGDYAHQLMLTATAPDEIKKLYDYGLEYNKRLIKHCAEHNVRIAMQGYDICMNAGCIVNPAAVRDIFFPFMAMVNAEIEAAGMIPFFHCCGNTWQILGDFVGAGYRGYQSIQKSAGMDWMEVKREYGRELTLWAGVQCETLVSGTLEDTEREVTRALGDLMPGGGFIFGSTNSVQYCAKTENYLKALEVVRKEGYYS